MGLRANISQKVGQIIVPMEGRKVKAAEMTKEDAEEVKPPTREEDFQRQVEALQSAARQGLVEQGLPLTETCRRESTHVDEPTTDWFHFWVFHSSPSSTDAPFPV